MSGFVVALQDVSDQADIRYLCTENPAMLVFTANRQEAQVFPTKQEAQEFIGSIHPERLGFKVDIEPA